MSNVLNIDRYHLHKKLFGVLNNFYEYKRDLR